MGEGDILEVSFRRATCPYCGANLESGRFTQEGFEPIEALRCPTCRHVILLSRSRSVLSDDFKEAVILSIHDEVRSSKEWMGSVELLKGLIPHLPKERVRKIQSTFLKDFGLEDYRDANVDVIDILFKADRSLPPEDLPKYVRSQIA
jgi:hypothetical protein